MTRPEIARRLHGIFAATPTPFTTAGEFDPGHLTSNLGHWGRQPLSGYVLLGSNGEAVLLTPDERVRVVEASRSVIPSDRLLIAGAGMDSTRATLEQAQRMARVGADAVIVVTPHYYKSRMTPAALERFYQEVADASPVPVILYSVPANTGIDLPLETVLRLATHPNIAGIKDSGGDVVKIGRVAREAAQDFCVMAGSAGFLLPALSMGAGGGITALANVAAGPLARLVEAFKAGDHRTAQRLQLTLLEPNLAVTSRFGVAGLKAALDMQGLYGGPVRPPLLPLPDEERGSLRRILAQAGLLEETRPV
jgi:4-hydroxy-2-oxoglutarate aldolase